MSFDLFFLAYNEKPPTLELAAKVVQTESEDEKPRPDLEQARAAVTAELMQSCPEYEFIPDERGVQYGGALSCESCDCPDVEFSPDHAFVPISYSADPEHAQKTLENLIGIFSRHRYVAYDPQRGRFIYFPIKSSEFSSYIGAVHDQVKSGILREPRKPWWKLW